MRATLAVLTAAFLLTTACGSAAKRAGEYMEKGLYDDAIRTYEEILRRDPNDTDAAAGLKAARTAWLDKRLIEVRLSRLSGGSDKALDMLMDVAGKEAQWGMAPGGKVAFTQNEESSFGMGYAEKVAAEAVAAKQPLRAEFFLLKYRKLFEGGSLGARFDRARARTKEAGKASCGTLLPASAKKHPYYYSFLRQYCGYWGEKLPDPSADSEKYHAVYFNEFEASALGVTNLPADIRVHLADAAKNAFERTAWFDPSGARSAKLLITGGYTLTDTKVPQYLQHMYTERVPYTEYVEVQKTRTVSYQENAVTKYRQENYKEKEPQTRYREVQRTHHYQGFQHERKITLGLSSQLQLEKKPVQVELSEVSQTGGIEHHENQPSIGLRPAHPNLMDAPSWLRVQSDRFAAQFEEKLAALWKETHCQGGSSTELPVLGDAVHQCLRQKMNEPPSFAENWYRQNFGVSVAEARMVLGK